jgi:hypothetical protein
MTSVATSACLVALAVALAAWIRASDRGGGKALQPRPALVEAAAVGASLRLAMLVPIFAWAAAGALAPAVIVAVAWVVGAGVGRRARRIAPRSAPVPAIAVAGISLVALTVAEATALTGVLRLSMPQAEALAAVVVFATMAVGAFVGTLGNPQAARRTINALLGLVALGLFGFAMLTSYAYVSSRVPGGGAASLAQWLALVAAIGLMVSGRTKYVDTHADEGGTASTRTRVVRRAAKVLNVVLSTMLGIVIVLAAMSIAPQIDVGPRLAELLPGRRSAGVVATLVVLAAIGGFLAAGQTRLPPVVPSRRTRAFEPALMILLVGASATMASSEHGAGAAAQALMSRIAREATLLDTMALGCIVVAACAAAVSAFVSTFAALSAMRPPARPALRAGTLAAAIAVVVTLAASPWLFAVALAIAGCFALPAIVLGMRDRVGK